jgi:hypothetical protein
MTLDIYGIRAAEKKRALSFFSSSESQGPICIWKSMIYRSMSRQNCILSRENKDTFKKVGFMAQRHVDLNGHVHMCTTILIHPWYFTIPKAWLVCTVEQKECLRVTTWLRGKSHPKCSPADFLHTSLLPWNKYPKHFGYFCDYQKTLSMARSLEENTLA